MQEAGIAAHFRAVNGELLVGLKDRQAVQPLGPVDAVLQRYAALVVVVPLLDEGGVAGAAAGRRRRVRAGRPAAQRRY